MAIGDTFTITIHVPGTLGADLAVRWTAHHDCSLIHVSAVGSNAYAAGLQIGTSASAEAYLAKASIGVSGTPVEFDWNEFVQYSSNKSHPHITDGTIVAIALDFNYNNGGSAQASADVTIVLTLTEG